MEPNPDKKVSLDSHEITEERKGEVKEIKGPCNYYFGYAGFRILHEAPAGEKIVDRDGQKRGY